MRKNVFLTSRMPPPRLSGFVIMETKMKKAQSIVEYAIAFVVVVSGIIAIGFIADARGVFQNHFDEVMQEMSMNNQPVAVVLNSDNSSEKDDSKTAASEENNSEEDDSTGVKAGGISAFGVWWK